MRTGYGFFFSLFNSRLSGFKGKRSEIRGRNNEKDTSFDLASFIYLFIYLFIYYFPTIKITHGISKERGARFGIEIMNRIRRVLILIGLFDSRLSGFQRKEERDS